MRFDEKSRLDTSQVRDTRGSRVPGGRVTIGGGIGVIGLIIALLLGIDPFAADPSAPGALPGTDQVQVEGQSGDQLAETCTTGADANTKDDCRVVAVVNSVQTFWDDEFARRGGQYSEAQTQLFSQGVNSGCGFASSEVGPFYCPSDHMVFLDLTFYQELRTRFGASGGPFAQAYVLAHEYGHHVQNLLGAFDQVGQGDRQGPTSGAVRLELQADCYAGVWAHNATTTPGPSGRPLVSRLTEADIADGLNAAAAVGDDRIQRQTQGTVTPETWTHGSSTQRQRWFTVGYQTGDMTRCDTFAAATL